ncbi:MAG TPA: hypothetical protein ENG95_02035 [Nitrospirae bacterium]|nr:hypothetical protein BMS3Abin10_00969 [bacterium BMS3Abin10]GBE39198.1 hypothetical protein BMS3Bbin08_01819 [bacterium BMS3Bbin08]HDH50304.1 hypothetical protein [Nitrospirota bacterium]HDK17678.1 hypothetical protein [Nitrospirota bacterium]HDK80974.1 hypothetical protein [Nitrospirota bacterium]
MKNILYIIVSILMITAGSAFAESSTAVVSVSATVLPIAELTVLHQETWLTLTTEDIQNGFVDVRQAVIISVKTNSENGYLLSFYAESSQLNAISVISGSNTYNISGTGGEVHMPYEGPDHVIKRLGFRFDLSEDSVPGTYQWPVDMMISSM